jgi:hypothetical protein
MTEHKEIVFLRTYKDFIYKFNMLDRNMAYFLRDCMRSVQGNSSTDKWHKVTFDQKLKKLLSIANKSIPERQYKILSQKLEECRLLRNVVVHGHWEWREFLDEPILYHTPEPFNQEGSLTVKAFQDKLSFL